LIWGVGPALLYPTGTHLLLGTGTFSIGPTVVVLEQIGGWTVGALMNQLWSVDRGMPQQLQRDVRPTIYFPYDENPYDFHH